MLTCFVVVAQLWVVVGDAPTGIDFRCTNASKNTNKLIVQGCVCDRTNVVNDVYSNSAGTMYIRTYCPGNGKKSFMSNDEAPADFCYGGTNVGQTVEYR